MTDVITAQQAVPEPTELPELPGRGAFRGALHGALQRALRSGSGMALVLVNLDGFQLINDQHGQDAGDALLRHVATRLAQLMRGGEVAAWLGADEFAILCERVKDAAGLSALAERINGAVRHPFEVGAALLDITASIGIALAAAGDDADALMRHAGIALQNARIKHDSWQFFDAGMQQRALQRQVIAKGLQLALARNEMTPYFQPIVDAQSGSIVGAELLLRWFAATGQVSPADFIPVAESCGAIVPIGAWVFRQACLAEADWRRRWGTQAPYVSVNVSVRQLDDDGLADVFGTILTETGADASRLLLEITESTLMDDIEAKLRVLHGLAALGLRVAIDDFGTGYSSLAQLTRLPVDVLKIDRAFVQGLAASGESRAVIAAVIGMGRALGLKMVAEGVETREQQLELCGYGCDLIQGYYFHRPMPLETLVATVDAAAAQGQAAQRGLHFLLYVSEEAQPMAPGQLERLLAASRARNTAAGVTGCLIYQAGRFMQMLEGERDTVLGVFERIKASTLHARVRIVIESPARRRVFTHWSMLMRNEFDAGDGPDFERWQQNTIGFDALALDARACYAYITAYVPDVRH